MEWRNGITWTTPLTFVVDPWLLLAGNISVLARLILLFSYSTVAVTGRKHLRPRPVDFVILFSVLDPWLLLARGNSVLARLILLFYLFSLLDLWLLLAGGISAIARLNLFIFAELLHDYYCLWLELSCGLCLVMFL